MQLMINGEYVEGEIHLVKTGVTKKRGCEVPVYAYEVSVLINEQKHTKQFKRYDECVKYLLSKRRSK